MAWHHALTVMFHTRLCRHVRVTRLCVCSVLLVFALGGTGFKCYEANQTITVLELSSNHIGSDGAVALAEALKAWLVMCVCSLVRVTFFCCCPEQSLAIDALVHFRLRNRPICSETCLRIAVVES